MARSKKVTVTEKEVLEIKKQNQSRLDEMFSNPTWRYELGKKHFGEARWQKVFFGEKHPDYDDWKKDPNREKIADTNRPISEWDEEGNLIDTYDNIQAALDKYGWIAKKGINVLDSAREKHRKAYGRLWKFEDIEEKEND